MKKLTLLLALLTPACVVEGYDVDTTGPDTQALPSYDEDTQVSRSETRLAAIPQIEYTEVCKDLCGAVEHAGCMEDWDNVFECVLECEADVVTCSPQEKDNLRQCRALYSNSCDGGNICAQGQTCQTTFTFGG